MGPYAEQPVSIRRAGQIRPTEKTTSRCEQPRLFGDADLRSPLRTGSPAEAWSPPRQSAASHKDATCCGVRWTMFFGLQFQMDCVGWVAALS